MQSHNESYLREKYHHWQLLRDAQVVSNLGNDTREQFLRIYREEIDPRALYCLTCSEDVATLVKNLYTWYDKQIKTESNEYTSQDQSLKGGNNKATGKPKAGRRS